MTQNDSPQPLETSELPSPAEASPLSTSEIMTTPLKPLIEMTDEELSQWHSSLTDLVLSPQKLAAHLRESGGKVAKSKQATGPNISLIDPANDV
jgi:hypothetical protein